jgi:hypothetical protein
LVKILVTALAASWSKGVITSVDPKEIVHYMLAHPDADVVVGVLLDSISHSTTDPAIVSQLETFGPIIKQVVKNKSMGSDSLEDIFMNIVTGKFKEAVSTYETAKLPTSDNSSTVTDLTLS